MPGGMRTQRNEALAVPMLSTIYPEEASNATNCVGQIVGVGQKNDTEMIGCRAIKARTLHDQDALFC